MSQPAYRFAHPRRELPQPLVRCARCNSWHRDPDDHARPILLPIHPQAPSWQYADDGVCRVRDCDCQTRRGLDLSLLDVYGIGTSPYTAHHATLTPNETKLVAALLPPGMLVRHEVLLHRVWGAAYTGEHHLLRVNIARIRAKLAPRWIIENANKIGYRLVFSRAGAIS